jgi:hypothetical protein
MPRTLAAYACLLLAVSACGGDTVGPGTPPPPPPPPANLITIDGNNIGVADGSVFISQGGAVITDASATVTANGVAASLQGSGYYYELASPLAPGAMLTIQASRLGKTATVVGTVPSTPVVVSPAVDATVTIGAPLTVTWTSPTNPSYYIVRLGYRIGTTGSSIRDSVGGTVRTINLSTTALPSGATNLSVDIRAIGTETLSGDVSPASRLRLFATTGDRNLTLNAGP